MTTQLTFQTMGGETVTVTPRGKHYVQPKGYADHPGTGPKGETCGSCAHHCVKSMGKGSDILVRAAACSKWEGESDV